MKNHILKIPILGLLLLICFVFALAIPTQAYFTKEIVSTAMVIQAADSWTQNETAAVTETEASTTVETTTVIAETTMIEATTETEETSTVETTTVIEETTMAETTAATMETTVETIIDVNSNG